MRRVEVGKISDSDSEDEWDKKHETREDSDLEWMEGLKDDGNLAVVPAYLTQNTKKKKKLMEHARRRVPLKIRAPTMKGGKAIPLKPQKFQMLQRNKQ